MYRKCVPIGGVPGRWKEDSTRLTASAATQFSTYVQELVRPSDPVLFCLALAFQSPPTELLTDCSPLLPLSLLRISDPIVSSPLLQSCHRRADSESQKRCRCRPVLITPSPRPVNPKIVSKQAKMKTNGFTLQIINAETREPMKEFQCPEGKLYVEAEPDVSTNIWLMIIFVN